MGETHCGARNPNWKGGRSLASNGYVLIRVGVGHPAADVRGYAYEHRLVAEQVLGRPLLEGEQVHHKDGDKQNNAPANLEVLTQHEHRAEHRKHERGLRVPGGPNPLVQCACGCGSTFPKYDGCNRPRRYVSGHNPSDSPVQRKVLAALDAGVMRVALVAEHAGITVRAVKATLSRLAKLNKVRRVRHGEWVRHG
ncbi:HNH endonuclease signature motif containing protein [Myxococcus eversor]|uniref:HNH endonuclease signature motif containing protein n=1 Tax=Myxococcus eversor TaxID=2709661 RepID=UPI0019688595|nr:HNH endonuclease signature motif containing protein [Myxococcus eversor]